MNEIRQCRMWKRKSRYQQIKMKSPISQTKTSVKSLANKVEQVDSTVSEMKDKVEKLDQRKTMRKILQK
jgi:hypothetical protein